MPTGFTEIIDNKPETTFREFALRCCRGMDVCMSLRDTSLNTPVPLTITPDPYHRDELAEAKDVLQHLLAMTPEEMDRRCTEANEQSQRQHIEGTTEYQEIRRRYLDMLAKVKEWTPPTPKHRNFQKFMEEQLTLGGGLGYDYSAEPAPKILTPKKWHAKAVKQAKEDITYHKKHWAIEQKRCAEATAWLQALYASLPEDK
jgi:hypothetical protein